MPRRDGKGHDVALIAFLLLLLSVPAEGAVYSHLLMDDEVRMGQVPDQTAQTGGSFYQKVASDGGANHPTSTFVLSCQVDGTGTGTGDQQDGYCVSGKLVPANRAFVYFTNQTYAETVFANDARGAADLRQVGLAEITFSGEIDGVRGFAVAYIKDDDSDRGFTRMGAIAPCTDLFNTGSPNQTSGTWDGLCDVGGTASAVTTPCQAGSSCLEGHIVHYATATNEWVDGWSPETEFAPTNDHAEWPDAVGLGDKDSPVDTWLIGYNNETGGNDAAVVACHADTTSSAAPICGSEAVVIAGATARFISVDTLGVDPSGDWDAIIGFERSNGISRFDAIEVNSTTRAISVAGGTFFIPDLTFANFDGRDHEVQANPEGTGFATALADTDGQEANAGIMLGVAGINSAPSVWSAIFGSLGAGESSVIVETDENATHPELVWLSETALLVTWVPASNNTPGVIGRIYDVDWTGGASGGPIINGPRAGTYAITRQDSGGTSPHGEQFDGDQSVVHGYGTSAVEVFFARTIDTGDLAFLNHGRARPDIQDGEVLWGMSCEVDVVQTVDPSDPGLLFDSFVGTGLGMSFVEGQSAGEVQNDRVCQLEAGSNEQKGGCVDLPEPMSSVSFYFDFSQPDLFPSAEPRLLVEMKDADGGSQAMVEWDPSSRNLVLYQRDRTVKECASSFVPGKICFGPADCDAEIIGEGDEGVPTCVPRTFGSYQAVDPGWSSTISDTIPHSATVVYEQTPGLFEARLEMGIGGASFTGSTKPTGVCDDGDATTEGDPCTVPGTGGLCGTGDCVANTVVEIKPVTQICFGAALESVSGAASLLIDNPHIRKGTAFQHGYFLDYHADDNANNVAEHSSPSPCVSGDEADCLDDFAPGGVMDDAGLQSEASGELSRIDTEPNIVLDSGNALGTAVLLESSIEEESTPPAGEYFTMWGMFNRVFGTGSLPMGIGAGIDTDTLLTNENPDLEAPVVSVINNPPWTNSIAGIWSLWSAEQIVLLSGHFDADGALNTEVENLTASVWVDEPVTTFTDAVVDRNGDGQKTACFGGNDSRMASPKIYEGFLSQTPSIDNALLCSVGGSQYASYFEYVCIGGTNDGERCDPNGVIATECPGATNPIPVHGGVPCRMNHEFVLKGLNGVNGGSGFNQCHTVLRGNRAYCDSVTVFVAPGNDATGRPVPTGMGFIIEDADGDGIPDGASGDPCSYDAPFERDDAEPFPADADLYCALGPNRGGQPPADWLCEGGPRHGLQPSATILCSGGGRDGLAPLDVFVCSLDAATACFVNNDQCPGLGKGVCVEQDACPGTGSGGVPAVRDFGCPAPAALPGHVGVPVPDCGQFLDSANRQRADASGPLSGWELVSHVNDAGNVNGGFPTSASPAGFISGQIGLVPDSFATFEQCNAADGPDHWTMKQNVYWLRSRKDGFSPPTPGAICVGATGEGYLDLLTRRWMQFSKDLNDDTGEPACDWCTGGDCTDDLGAGNEARCNDHDVIAFVGNDGYLAPEGSPLEKTSCFTRFRYIHNTFKQRFFDTYRSTYAPAGQSNLDYIDFDSATYEMCDGGDPRACLSDGGHVLPSGESVLGTDSGTSGYNVLQQLFLQCFQDNFGPFVDCSNTVAP